MAFFPNDPLRSGKTRRAASSGSEPICSATSMPHNPSPARGWREPMIGRAAYFRSLNCQFQPGKELEDWLAAEQEIDHLIACGAAPYC